MNVIEQANAVPIKLWTDGVPVEDQARKQLMNMARLPIVGPHLAVMPDVHLGIGATVGSVVPTSGAIIPAAVGVDIGCGMIATRTSLVARDLPDNLGPLRSLIEQAVPHGRSVTRGGRDKGSFETPPEAATEAWRALEPGFKRIVEAQPGLAKSNHYHHLGTLGTGNHFIEICLDTEQRVWVMLHSGSRGVGNAIGSRYIEVAKADMGVHVKDLPDQNLAYLREGTQHFDAYVHAVGWAQDYARRNREIMMLHTLKALRKATKRFEVDAEAVNCHHNYVEREEHYGQSLYVTRKGAVSARAGQLGIIPGSMGARSYIVRGLGNAESFCSCSHGAGRVMSRTEARKRISLAQHRRATEGVECRKDEDVIDESPAAYKPIDQVMAAQRELVEVVHELRQVVCVKG
ncbi:MAG: RtcB family protein [Lysobacterales bacterium]